VEITKAKSMKKTLYIYTDGSADNKTENAYGGWAYIFSENKEGKDHFFEESGRERGKSGKMELLAIYYALFVLIKKKAYKEYKGIIIKTDSEYARNTLLKIPFAKGNFPVVNKAEIMALNKLGKIFAKKKINITYEHVRGHVGIYGNEICDKLANKKRKNA